MSQYTNPGFQEYNKDLTHEENVANNAVITKKIMDDIAQALTEATAGMKIEVSTADTASGEIVVDPETYAKTIKINMPVIAGEPGANGISPTISIGTVTTGTEVSVVNSGTDTNVVLDFVLPVSQPSTASNTKEVVITLLASGWGEDQTQRVAVEGLTSTSVAIMGYISTSTADQVAAINSASLTFPLQEDGYITFKYNSTAAPTIDLPINVIILP